MTWYDVISLNRLTIAKVTSFSMQLSGIVYVGPRVAETLLELHTRPPLDACTYIGLDNGAQPLSVSELPTHIASGFIECSSP